MRYKLLYCLCLVLFAVTACSPVAGPDKSLAGAALGAGWGAGAGAVVGHQVGAAGEGVAIGAGYGIVKGAMTGAGYDIVESEQLRQREQLQALSIQNDINAREIRGVVDQLDRTIAKKPIAGVYQVFFDPDATSLRSGAIANLEALADSIRESPQAAKIKVIGHADDAGTPDYNKRIAEARARNVSAYLAARGISSHQIEVESKGSQRPIATNATPTGRQLNRRVDIFIAE